MDDKGSKRYKKYTLLLVIVTVVALIVCVAALSTKHNAVAAQGNPENSDTSYYTPKPTLSQETASSQEASQQEDVEEYLVSVYNGKIGVFRKGEASPFLIADTQVYLLPQEDIDILQKGIAAKGLSQVKSILEDYE